jgi:hypothetical protein
MTIPRVDIDQALTAINQAALIIKDAGGERLYSELRFADATVIRMRDELDRWDQWSQGSKPDDSPGDVIDANWDGTIVLDDGIVTWNPLRALAFLSGRGEGKVHGRTA